MLYALPTIGEVSTRGRWAVLGLLVSFLGSAGVLVTTFLPWYSVGGWHSLAPGRPGAEEFNALALIWDGGIWQPGSARFGIALLGCACVMVVLTLASTLALVRGWRMQWWLVAIGLAATILLVLTLLQAYATPPFGDEPPLAYTWGAVLGVLAAAVSFLGGWSAWLAQRKTLPLKDSPNQSKRCPYEA
jgi:hypothetical protein